MIKLCAHDDCTGCLACKKVCPKNAISVVYKNGFVYPEIDYGSCVQCGKCINICPSLNAETKAPQVHEVYACYSKDDNIRRNSSSGGIFTILASSIIEREGAVCGVTVDEQLNIMHTIVSEEKDLFSLRGSKYVQSDVQCCYSEIDSLLEKGQSVLFSGTPCQVAAINRLIRRNRENLYTIDFICHGVPSPKFFHAYCSYLEKRYQSKILFLKFRDKEKGWMFFNMRVQFENGQVYIGEWHTDPFIRGFLRDLVLRPCCYTCRYRSRNRESDITLADYWEYTHHNYLHWNTDEGISKVIINTEKGKNWYQNSLNIYDVRSFTRTLLDKKIIDKSLSSKCIRPDTVDIFWQDFETDDFESLIEKYLFSDSMSLKNRLRQVIIKLPFAGFVLFIFGKIFRSINKYF